MSNKAFRLNLGNKKQSIPKYNYNNEMTKIRNLGIEINQMVRFINSMDFRYLFPRNKIMMMYNVNVRLVAYNIAQEQLHSGKIDFRTGKGL